MTPHLDLGGRPEPGGPLGTWFGYSLGQWSDELDNEAQLAVEGRHFETGEKLKQIRVKVR